MGLVLAGVLAGTSVSLAAAQESPPRGIANLLASGRAWADVDLQQREPPSPTPVSDRGAVPEGQQGTLEMRGGTTTESAPSARSALVAVAAVAEEAPVLDGDVLGDSIWNSVEPVTGFWQTTPNDGEPASERTEVRVIYTADTIYFGVVCYDRDPSSIIVSDSRRDASLDETDSFQIILDTYLDTQNGFVFGTNPAGIEYDGQVTNEGQGSGRFGGGGGGGRPGQGGQQRGAGGGFNLNWDAAWQVRTRISEIGWTAEFAIPFRTIRYPSKDTLQTWGLNFQRNIRRRNETAYWAPIPRQYNLYRLSLAGTLTGMEIGGQTNFKVTPYVLGESLTEGERPRETVGDGDFGIDAKYSLTPSLTLDATYNTDFAQVEVDEQQINLDRFNLFFPEKRPFFLENAGFFTVGAPSQVELFFSRRIGIDEDGSPLAIVGGGRVSGKAGGNSIGLLNMQTEESGATPANNFTVARVSRELPNRSSLGGVFVNRQATGDLAGDKNYNRTFGFDGRLGIGESGLVSGFVSRTVTPGLDGDDHAYRVRADRNTPAFDLNLGYTEVADNFNPEVGFLSRGGYRSISSRVMRRIRPGSFIGIQELRPHVSYNSFWNFDGFQETGFIHIDQHWEWRAGHEAHTGMNITREGVVTAFEISDGVFVPPGTYDHNEAQIVFFTNEGAPLTGRIETTIGGFFGGDRVRISPSVRLRIGDSFNTEVGLDRNDIDLPGGAFVTNLARARVSYSFTPRIFTQALVQYNDNADIWSANLRFGWLQAANTGLFVVYNDTRGLVSSTDPHVGGQSLIVKFSRLFDLAN